jgi:hypothetical protein
MDLELDTWLLLQGNDAILFRAKSIISSKVKLTYEKPDVR